MLRKPTVLSNIGLLLLLQPVTSAPLKPSAKRRLGGACEHGADGVLVAYNNERSEMSASFYDKYELIELLLGKPAFSGDDAEILYKLYSISTVAARLSASAIDELLHDDDVKSITDNCIIQLDDPTETIQDGAGSRRHRLAVSEALSWGLDRIDQRDSITDGYYDDSGATGSGALVYVVRSRAQPPLLASRPRMSLSLSLSPEPRPHTPHPQPTPGLAVGHGCAHLARRLWRPRSPRLVGRLPDWRRAWVR